MPQNPRLAGVLDTEEKTPVVAQWLIDLAMKYHQAAAPGSCESEAGAGVAIPVETALKNYRAHRAQGDKERAPTHSKLCEQVRFSLAAFRNNYLKNVPVPGVMDERGGKIATKEDFENLVNLRIEKANWTFKCFRCGTNRAGESVDGKYICVVCAPTRVAECHDCGDKHLTDNMTRFIREDGEFAYFCAGQNTKKKCNTKVKSKMCQNCGNMFIGQANIGARYSERMTREGIEACVNCGGTWRELSCGHLWNGDGHTRTIVVDTEDDNRPRERVQGEGQRVCGHCRNDDHDDVLPEYWRQQVAKVQGSLFREIGSTRTYGVELEFCGVYRMPTMDEDIKKYWTAKEDASLPRNGVEMASTILHGDEGLERIRELCEYAAAPDGNPEKKWAVDARGGFHLHIGLTDDTVKQVAAIAMGYVMTYEMWRQFVAPSRTNSCKYCLRTGISSSELVKLNYDQYIARLVNVNDRRVWCNWHSYVARKTVEIRVHHATKVYDKIANWAKAHARFCDWCAQIGDPRKVHDRLQSIERDPRKLFLLVSQEAWKDRELGRWYRGRAEVLHGKGARIKSHRQLRKAGIDPKKVPQGIEDVTLYGLKPFVFNINSAWYICTVPKEIRNSVHSQYIQTRGHWGSGDAMCFRDQDSAEKWVMGHADQKIAAPEPAAPVARDWEAALLRAQRAARRLPVPDQPVTMTVEEMRRIMGVPLEAALEPTVEVGRAETRPDREIAF